MKGKQKAIHLAVEMVAGKGDKLELSLVLSLVTVRGEVLVQ